MLALLGTIGASWDDPNLAWVLDRLSRAGAASDWFHWNSAAVYRWCIDHGIPPYSWNRGSENGWSQIWLVDLRTCAFDRMLHEQLAFSDDSFLYTVPPKIVDIDGRCVIDDGAGWLVYDRDAQRLRRIARWEYPSLSSEPEAREAHFSDDGRFVFDHTNYDRLVAWDSTRCDQYIPFPLQDDDIALDKRITVRGVVPLRGTSAAVVTYAAPSSYGTNRAVIWWPQRNRLTDYPAAWADYWFRPVALAGRGRYLVGEQFGSQRGYQAAWDCTQDVALPDPAVKGLARENEEPDTVLAAVSRTEGKAYLYGFDTPAKWYEWDLATGHLTDLSHEPQGDLVWVRSKAEFTQLRPALGASNRQIVLRSNGDMGNVEETIVAPHAVDISSWQLRSRDRLSPNQRFLVVNCLTGYAVFDRTTKRWIGRFGSTDLTQIVTAAWSDGGKLLVVAGEWCGHPRVLVYDMTVY